MLSQKCKYAIRAVLLLSLEQRNDKLMGAREIATALKMPFAFTGKILQELVKKGIISSTKGPKGGFYLSKQDLNHPLIRIVEAIDDISFFNSCGLGLSECSEEHPCPVHDTFKIARDNLLTLFKTKLIKDLSDEILRNKLSLVR